MLCQIQLSTPFFGGFKKTIDSSMITMIIMDENTPICHHIIIRRNSIRQITDIQTEFSELEFHQIFFREKTDLMYALPEIIVFHYPVLHTTLITFYIYSILIHSFIHRPYGQSKSLRDLL